MTTIWTVSTKRHLMRDGEFYAHLKPIREVFEFLSTIKLTRGCYIYQNTKKINDEVFETDYHVITFKPGKQPVFTPKDENDIFYGIAYAKAGAKNINEKHSNEIVEHGPVRLYFDFDTPVTTDEFKKIEEWVHTEYGGELRILKSSTEEKYHVVTNVAMNWTQVKLAVQKFTKDTGVRVDIEFTKSPRPALRAPFCKKFGKEGGIYIPQGEYPVRDYFITPTSKDINVCTEEVGEPPRLAFNPETWKFQCSVSGKECAMRNDSFIYVNGECLTKFVIEREDVVVASDNGYDLVANWKVVAGKYKRLSGFTVVVENSLPIERVDTGIPNTFNGHANTKTLSEHSLPIWFSLPNSLYINTKNEIYKL